MAFMEPQVTSKRLWLEIDGSDGITFVDSEDAPDLLAAVQTPEGTEMEELPEDIAEKYYDGVIVNDVRSRVGYGARLSAPGYLDCTPWTVFDTQEEAELFLKDTYEEG